jgi:hypothetical protein
MSRGGGVHVEIHMAGQLSARKRPTIRAAVTDSWTGSTEAS